MNQSDFNTSGGTLFAVFKTSGGIEYQTSCSYTITKTQVPTFTLSPTTTTVSCGSTSPVTFSVANVYNSSGTLSYAWSIGSGWTGTVNSSLSSITLTPSSAVILPSNVLVTPILNGISYPTKTCTVYRAPFISAAIITGNIGLCNNTPTTYTVTGLSAGSSVLSWSISDSTIATLGNTSGISTTLTKVGSGSVTLLATIQNSCNQTITIPKIISVGAPILPNSATITGPTNTSYNQTLDYVLNGDATNGGTSYFWSVDAPINDNSGTTCAWQIISGQGTKNVKLLSGCIATTAVVKVVATSNCGISNTKYIYVNVGNAACVPTLQLLQNPITNRNLLVNVIYPPCGNAKNANLNITNDIKIYDFSGNAVFSDKQTSDELSINNLLLKKGIYILQVTTENGTVLKNKISIQ